MSWVDEPDWRLGDLTGWDEWSAGVSDDTLLGEVGRWISELCERPWLYPSVPVQLNPPEYLIELRAAVLPWVGGVRIAYSVHNLAMRIDIDEIVGP